MKRRRFKTNAQRRDIMEVGVQARMNDSGAVGEDLKLDEYLRCPHCYQSKCRCKGGRQRHGKYSSADYAPYEFSEDDLIACIDLKNSLEDDES